MLTLLLSTALVAGQPENPGSLAPDRDWDLEHLHLDLAIDLEARRVEGSATLRVAPLLPGGASLKLYQEALDIHAVRVDGEEAAFTLGDGDLEIQTGARTAPIEITIDYSAEPRTGLHFRSPGRHSPDTYTEVWSQGEGTDNRYWFPSWDYPNDRFTYSGRFQVDPAYKVLSNGVGEFDGEAWTYHLDQDLVNYLVMLAVGPYQERSVTWRDKTIRQWFPPDATEEEVLNASGRVPEILEFFSNLTGLEYPYPTYTEVFIQRFLYSGMENTTATVEDRRLLHPDVEAVHMRNAESVVAHEAAHQWFGDALTCRTWHELWLNEGFASFFDGLWMGHVEGEAWYYNKTFIRYRRALNSGPMAGRWWSTEEGNHGSNSHVYVRGSSVLQMLLVMLGEEAFWASMQRYTQENAHSLVDTDDLREAFEAVTGRHLTWFFDQWVHLGGSPKLVLQHSHREGQLTINLRQSHEGEEASRLFTLPIDLEIGTAEGVIERRVWMEQADLRLVVDLEEAPTYVALDPHGGLLASLENKQSAAMWRAQLDSPSPYARLQAIRELGKKELDEANLESLARLLAPSQDETTRLVAIEALQNLGDPRGAPLLVESMGSDPSGMVRASAADALGILRGDSVAGDALARAWRGERDVHIKASILAALAHHRESQARRFSRQVLRTRIPYRAPLHQAALNVLRHHGEAGDLDAVVGLLQRNTPHQVLHSAAWTANRLAHRAEDGEARREARETVARAVEPLLDSDHIRTRETAIAVLGSVGDNESILVLRALRSAESVEETRERISDAIRSIHRGESAEEDEEGELNDAQIRARLQDLEERIDAMEEAAIEAAERH